MTAAVGSTRLFSTLRQTAEALDEQRQPWALVGGLAVSVRSEPRFTRDIGVAVSVADDGIAEGVVSRLLGGGFRLLLSLEHQALGRLAAVRLARRMTGNFWGFLGAFWKDYRQPPAVSLTRQ